MSFCSTLARERFYVWSILKRSQCQSQFKNYVFEQFLFYKFVYAQIPFILTKIP